MVGAHVRVIGAQMTPADDRYQQASAEGGGEGRDLRTALMQVKSIIVLITVELR